jgi:AraC-like DNA-binding protein
VLSSHLFLLRALWELDIMEKTVKQVADEAGFGSRNAFDLMVKRVAGMSPVSALREMGFAEWLDRLSPTLGAGGLRANSLGQPLNPTTRAWNSLSRCET